MTPREIPNKLTPLPEWDFIFTAAQAWKRFYGEGPQVGQLACCLAQMILEVGREEQKGGSFLWGVHAHNFNVGNIKSKPNDGSHWQFYDCGEEVSLEEATRLDKEMPALVSIKKTYAWPNGAQRASVWFLAPHPWTRFRAYETAEEGLLDYIDFLVMERSRYLTAWNQGVMKGDPVTFSLELGKAGYYTADPTRYTKTVVSLFAEFEVKVKAVLESQKGRQLYDGTQQAAFERAMAIVGTSIQDALRGEFEGVDALDEDEARAAQTANVPVA
jgi:hypothetical protein